MAVDVMGMLCGKLKVNLVVESSVSKLVTTTVACLLVAERGLKNAMIPMRRELKSRFLKSRVLCHMHRIKSS